MITKNLSLYMAKIGRRGGRNAARKLTKAQRRQRAIKARAARNGK